MPVVRIGPGERILLDRGAGKLRRWKDNITTSGPVEDVTVMVHFSCDSCGKDLPPDDGGRYVVKMEAFAATDPARLTDDDLDADHVEEVGQMLEELEEAGEEAAVEPARQAFRFDLCPACYRKFRADPLGRETVAKFDFSKN